MQLGEILQKTTLFFKEKEIASARLDAELLVAEALGLNRIDLYIKFEYPLNEIEIQKCRDFVRRRSQGEPVAYILQKKDFYNSTFFVKSGVLIPRPETEGIVDEALSWIKKNNFDSYPLEIADFGSGCGCLGLSLLKELLDPDRVKLTGIDVSQIANEVAKENSLRLEIKNADFHCCRVQDFDFANKRFAIIVANPPYIDKDDQNVQAHVRTYEPASALFAEDQGTREIADWANVAAKILQPKAFVAFEIGATQGEIARKIFEKTGQFASIRLGKDLAGLDRFIFAEKS